MSLDLPMLKTSIGHPDLSPWWAQVSQVCVIVAHCVCLSHYIKLFLLHIFITWILPSRKEASSSTMFSQVLQNGISKLMSSVWGSWTVLCPSVLRRHEPLLLQEHAPVLSQHVMNSLFTSNPDQRYCTDRCLTMAALIFLQLILSSWSSSLS